MSPKGRSESEAVPGERSVERLFDTLVVGSGVAGCVAALRLADEGLAVGLVSKDLLGQSTSWFAQGGIAAALPGTEDRPEDHLHDTVLAGGGLCDEAATKVLVEGASAAVLDLLELGARFDRSSDGALERAREGGHRVKRVVHAGGAATGAEVVRALSEAVRASTVALFEATFAYELVVDNGRCGGVRVLDADGRRGTLLASHVVLATGGAGQLFAVTTNPPGATGDGIVLALHAGVPVADLEFVQFHPTALAVAQSPRPLLSEALRGEGALLLDRAGRRFVDELEPRDVVSRAIAAKLAVESSDHVFLDARPITDFARRFPSLAASLARARLDAAKDLLPVAPAAHYLCGGVLTDLDGATALSGLWAIGEVACSGVHGANRLASNSLLEGLVFGARAAAAIGSGKVGPDSTGSLGPLVGSCDDGEIPVRLLGLQDAATTRRRAPKLVGHLSTRHASVPTRPSRARDELARAASRLAGVVRDKEGLTAFSEVVAGLRARLASEPVPTDRARFELFGLLDIADVLTDAALEREESRGTHFRSDHPRVDDASFRLRLAFGRAVPEVVDSTSGGMQEEETR